MKYGIFLEIADEVNAAYGIMISRRPKRRASSEKAPGPSKRSAADIAAILKAANVLMWLFAPAIKNDEMPIMR